MVSAHAALTLARLRTLVRFRRDGVEGVDEILFDLSREQPQRLVELLGIEPGALDAITTSEEAAALIVAATDSAARRARSTRGRQARRTSERLAQRLAESSLVRDDGCVDLNIVVLDDLCRSGGFHHLGLWVGDRLGVIERRHVKAMLQSCRNTFIRALFVTSDVLRLDYATDKSSGHLCLLLHPPTPEHDILVVPEPRTAPEPIAEDGPREEAEARPLPVPLRQRRRSFFDALSDALVEAL